MNDKMPCSATAAELSYDGGGECDLTEADYQRISSENIEAAANGEGRIGFFNAAELMFESVSKESWADLIREACVHIAAGRIETDEAQRAITRAVVDMVEDAAHYLAIGGYHAE
jgi:hypothetical protein